MQNGEDSNINIRDNNIIIFLFLIKFNICCVVFSFLLFFFSFSFSSLSNKEEEDTLSSFFSIFFSSTNIISLIKIRKDIIPDI